MLLGISLRPLLTRLLTNIYQALKECADEIDLGTQYHLTRYAFLFESIVLNDASTLVPSPLDEGGSLNHSSDAWTQYICIDAGLGLKAHIETIDNRQDFKIYMQNYAYARGGLTPRGPRREGPADEGFVSIPTFHLLTTC